MERYTIIENFEPKNDPLLLAKAQSFLPVLKHTEVSPKAAFFLSESSGTANTPVDLDASFSLSLGPGSHICYDFGTHWVGYVTLALSFTGSHPDAPAYIRLQFAERETELYESEENYHGWISKSWIQQEYLHVDKLPASLRLPRRYAFRFLKLTVLDTSRKFSVRINDLSLDAVSAVDLSAVPDVSFEDSMLSRIDAVSVKTLSECMQEVFEDGPKRDRRLWLGDLRLEALANYATFNDLNSVRRCLYLFAGTRFPDDRVSACLFTDGEAVADDTWFSDYALLYPVALAEYIAHSDDREALHDLYETAVFQLDRAVAACDTDGIVSAEDIEAAFIDWAPNLEKSACMQGLFLYTLSYGRYLARKAQDADREKAFAKAQELGRAGARARFWDSTNGAISSGIQDSSAARIWLTLGGVLTQEEAKHALLVLPAEVPLVSPYIHHYYLEALLTAGEKEAALQHLKFYWGGMIQQNADTFWEIWNPEDPDASPYGGTIVNSYCHAWSCSPSYFLRNNLL